MLDQKVVEEARQAWDKFMQQVNRMECRMLTAMADQIDKQWAEMVAPVAAPENEPFCWAAGIKEKFFFACHRTKRDADDAAVEAAMGIRCQEWDVWPLYAAPVAVPADQPPKPSGVAAAAATAADVARSVAETPEQQHDAATCCAERQEPDVGEGWRELGPEEILREDDEVDIGHNDPMWVPTRAAGHLAAESGDRYRRRATPNEKPLGAFLDEENNTLRAENATLRSEVERLRLTASQVGRLRQISTYLNNNGFIGYAADIDAILKRQGGGE